MNLIGVLREGVLDLPLRPFRMRPKTEAPLDPGFSQIAEKHLDTINDVYTQSLAFDERALLEHDVFLRDGLKELSDFELEQKILEVGSFLGEVVIRRIGGTWEKVEAGWSVAINDVRIFPFQQAEKRLLLGRKESLIYFFQILKRIVEERVNI